MFDPTSRYSGLPIKQESFAGPDGKPRVVRYVARRFVPPQVSTTTMAIHRVASSERLDHLAARYLGDPAQFWRIADANLALRPEELTAEPGREVRIAQPEA